MPYQAGRFQHAYDVRPEAKVNLPNGPAASIGRLYYDTILHKTSVLEFLVKEAGADRVLLGSDYPFDMGNLDCVARVRAAAIDPAARDLILGGYAQERCSARARMLERRLGTTDVRVSALGLGCNNFGVRTDLPAARNIVAAALDAGITFFDTADVYGLRGGSETILGEVLGARRKDIFLVSKFGVAMDDEGKLKGGSARYVASAIEASLKRLKTDWIDLYYYHRPDPATPLEETLRALDALIAQGKVRYIGCSNMSAAQLAEAATDRARQRPAPLYRLPRINTTCCRGRSRPISFRRCRRSGWR